LILAAGGLWSQEENFATLGAFQGSGVPFGMSRIDSAIGADRMVAADALVRGGPEEEDDEDEEGEDEEESDGNDDDGEGYSE
jgi:hypothetical protein